MEKSKDLNNNEKIRKNKVNNRFLPLTESVLNGLEPEGKITDYKIIRQIGEGSFGKVFLVRHIKTGMEYAIKQINKLNKNNQEGKPYFRREIEIMYKIHQKNVVKLYSHFEDNEFCYFVMEYVEKGNLFSQPSWLKNHMFTSFEVAKIIKEVICAIYYLHNMNPPIIHRDIKPENVLIDKDGVAKLTDFGWSNYVDSKEIRSTYCGTPVYLAPEMITEIGHDEHLDIWCIGVLLFELLTGNVPFRGKDIQSLNNNILSLKILWPKDINLDAKNLISKILKPDPEERISLVDMLKHPFFTKKLKIDNLYTCLIKPETRKYPPFIISEYTIEGYEKLINEKTDKNDETNTKTEEITKNSLPIDNIESSCNFGDFSKEEVGGGLFETNSIKDDNKIENSNINVNQLYSNLMGDYEALTNNYNKILLEKYEQTRKIDECNNKINLLQTEKADLIKEIDDKNEEKLKLKAELEDTKQELAQKINLIENYKSQNGVSIYSSCDNSKILEDKDNEIKLLKEKLCVLEKNSLKNNDIKSEAVLNGFRDSINHLSNLSTEMLSCGVDKNNQKMMQQMEEKLKTTKAYFEEEIKRLQSDFVKDKENYDLIIKIKDEEITKLVKNKDVIKTQEAKKYENIISKYEQLVKEKETEIEMLKLKNKKLVMIAKSYQAKQEGNQ